MTTDVLHAIYTTKRANDQAWPYTRKRRQTEAGTQNQVIGKVLASHLAQLSYVVMRRRIREPYTKIHVQHSNHGCQGVPKPRVYYRVKSVTYLAATIDWDSGEVTELAAFPTQRQAQAEAKRLHGLTQ